MTSNALLANLHHTSTSWWKGKQKQILLWVLFLF